MAINITFTYRRYNMKLATGNWHHGKVLTISATEKRENNYLCENTVESFYEFIEYIIPFHIAINYQIAC